MTLKLSQLFAFVLLLTLASCGGTASNRLERGKPIGAMRPAAPLAAAPVSTKTRKARIVPLAPALEPLSPEAMTLALEEERKKAEDTLTLLAAAKTEAAKRAEGLTGKDAALEAAEVPYSPAYDSDTALEDPQAVHLGIKVSADHAAMGQFTTVRAPYNFDGKADGDVRPPPMLDEHGAEIRAELAAAG